MIKKFRHVCITVGNLDKSLKFYGGTLGFKVSKVLTVEGEYPEKVLNKKGVRLTYAKIYGPGQPKNEPPVLELHYWIKPRILPKAGLNHISFTVKDIDREYKKLKKRGVKFLSKPVKTPYKNTKICFCRDPEKNLIEFIEEL